jgi:hypothetical protein
MSEPPIRKVKLRGSLPQMASSASIREDGHLVIEVFDWSDEAQQWLGNDVAYFMILAPEQKAGILALLAAETGAPPFSLSGDDHLLALIQQRFADYYDVKRWLDGTGIPYDKDFDSWA